MKTPSTGYLLEGLRAQKDARLDKVFENVKSNVTDDATANGWKQHPFFSASDAAIPAILVMTPSRVE